MDALANLAHRLVRVDDAVIDGAAGSAARLRLFDTLAAAAAGLSTPEAALLRQLSTRLAGPAVRDATPRERCRLLVGATRATEIDDIDTRSCTTVGSVVVPVALSLAAQRQQSPDSDRRALLGIVAGYEALVRLGRALGGASLIYRGVWPTLAAAPFASAAVAGVSLGFDAALLERALGIALQQTQLVPTHALAQPGYRSFVLGEAAVRGWIAALAAQSGLRPAEKALGGFCDIVGSAAGALDFDAAALTRDPETAAVTSVDTKSFPTSRQALASVAAFRSLLPLSIDDVRSVSVRVPEHYLAMVDRPAMPKTRIESMIGVQYSIALAACGSETLFDVRRDDLPAGGAIEEWMRKVEVSADEQLTREFPERWGGRVEVALASGETVVAEEIEPPGCAAAPFGWSELLEKHTRIAVASGLARPESVGDLAAACREYAVAGATPRSLSLLELVESVAALRSAGPASVEAAGGEPRGATRR